MTGSAGWRHGSMARRLWLRIWGRERLTIESGQRYLFSMPVAVRVDVAGQEPAAVPTTVVYALPERTAIDLYGRGQLHLPAEQVADVVTRFQQRTLKLDDASVHRVLHRYHAQAGPMTSRKQAAALRRRLDRAFAGGTPAMPKAPGYPDRGHRGSLDQRIAAGLRRAELPPPVVLPEHFSSGSASRRWSPSPGVDGGALRLFGAVQAAVHEVRPGALRDDPLLRQRLATDLAGKR